MFFEFNDDPDLSIKVNITNNRLPRRKIHYVNMHKAYKVKKIVSDIVKCRRLVMEYRKIGLKIRKNNGRIFY